VGKQFGNRPLGRPRKKLKMSEISFNEIKIAMLI
jgi:hypothetical protein